MTDTVYTVTEDGNDVGSYEKPEDAVREVDRLKEAPGVGKLDIRES